MIRILVGAFVLFTLSVGSAGDTGAQTLMLAHDVTGCLTENGRIIKLQVGNEPKRPCRNNEQEVSFQVSLNVPIAQTENPLLVVDNAGEVVGRWLSNDVILLKFEDMIYPVLYYHRCQITSPEPGQEYGNCVWILRGIARSVWFEDQECAGIPHLEEAKTEPEILRWSDPQGLFMGRATFRATNYQDGTFLAADSDQDWQVMTMNSRLIWTDPGSNTADPVTAVCESISRSLSVKPMVSIFNPTEEFELPFRLSF